MGSQVCEIIKIGNQDTEASILQYTCIILQTPLIQGLFLPLIPVTSPNPFCHVGSSPVQLCIFGISTWHTALLTDTPALLACCIASGMHRWRFLPLSVTVRAIDAALDWRVFRAHSASCKHNNDAVP